MLLRRRQEYSLIEYHLPTGCILRRHPRPARPLPVTDWARAYGLIPEPGSGPDTVPLIGPGPGFDPGYAMSTDLSVD